MSSLRDNSSVTLVRRELGDRGFYAWDNESIAGQIVDGIATLAQEGEFPFSMAGLEPQLCRSDYRGVEVLSCNRFVDAADYGISMVALGAVALDANGQVLGYANAECHDIALAFPSVGAFLEMLSTRQPGDEHIADVVSWQDIYPWERIQRLLVRRSCEVVAAARGRGLGKALIEEIIRRAVAFREPTPTLTITKPCPLNWGICREGSPQGALQALVDFPDNYVDDRNRILRHWLSCFPYMRTVCHEHTREPFLIGMVPGGG